MSALLLTADIGNTSATLRIHDAAAGSSLAIRDASAEGALLRAWIEECSLDCERATLLYSTVAPERTRYLLEAFRTLGIHRAVPAGGSECPLDLEVRCQPAAAVGLDRLLVASQARALCGGDTVVVDCGTAITIDAVNASGAFLGGAIAPGARLMAEALQRGTELLPAVHPRPVTARAARNTEGAIALALHHGLGGLIDRLAALVGSELGDPEVFLTGGDAERLAAALRTPHRLEPDLVHDALVRLWQRAGG